MTMPHSAIDSAGVELRPLPLARLRTDLEKALRFHEERLRHTPTADDDISMAVYRRSENAREEVLAALSRIATNTYGMCAACHRPISEERLEAMPHTRHCVTCARQAGR